MLLDQEALDRSPVVANAAMNRERRLHGTNSYARELGIDPLDCGLERDFFSVVKLPVPPPAAPFNPQSPIPNSAGGARDTAGPNYTGQPGVDSFYALPE